MLSRTILRLDGGGNSQATRFNVMVTRKLLALLQ